METETLLWIAFILILIEYNFRLHRSSAEKIEQRFEKLKKEFLDKKKANDSIKIEKK